MFYQVRTPTPGLQRKLPPTSFWWAKNPIRKHIPIICDERHCTLRSVNIDGCLNYILFFICQWCWFDSVIHYLYRCIQSALDFQFSESQSFAWKTKCPFQIWKLCDHSSSLRYILLFYSFLFSNFPPKTPL